MPVIPPLQHLSHPDQERGREGSVDKRGEKEKKEDWGGRMRGRGERIGAGAREKEKITLLPGLMNKGK